MQTGATEAQSSHCLPWWRPLSGWNLCVGARGGIQLSSEDGVVYAPCNQHRTARRPCFRNWHRRYPALKCKPSLLNVPFFKYYIMFYSQLCFNWEHLAGLLTLMGRFTWVRVAGKQHLWRQLQKPIGIIDLTAPESVKSSGLIQTMQTWKQTHLFQFLQWEQWEMSGKRVMGTELVTTLYHKTPPEPTRCNQSWNLFATKLYHWAWLLQTISCPPPKQCWQKSSVPDWWKEQIKSCPVQHWNWATKVLLPPGDSAGEL